MAFPTSGLGRDCGEAQGVVGLRAARRNYQRLGGVAGRGIDGHGGDRRARGWLPTGYIRRPVMGVQRRQGGSERLNAPPARFQGRGGEAPHRLLRAAAVLAGRSTSALRCREQRPAAGRCDDQAPERQVGDSHNRQGEGGIVYGCSGILPGRQDGGHRRLRCGRPRRATRPNPPLGHFRAAATEAARDAGCPRRGLCIAPRFRPGREVTSGRRSQWPVDTVGSHHGAHARQMAVAWRGQVAIVRPGRAARGDRQRKRHAVHLPHRPAGHADRGERRANQVGEPACRILAEGDRVVGSRRG